MVGWHRVVAAGADVSTNDDTSSPTSTTATASSSVTTWSILGVPVGEIDKIEPQPQRAKITFWRRRQVQGARRRQGGDPLAALVTSRAIQLTPAYTEWRHAWPTARSSRRTHRGAGRVGRPARAAGEAHRSLQPTDPAASALWVRSSTPPPTTCAARAPISATPSSTLSQAFGARRPQQRHLRHREEPLDPGVGAARQHRPDASAQRQPRRGDRPAGQRSRRGRPAVADLNAAVGDVAASWPTTARRSGTTSDKLASITQALVDSLDDIKQTLHVAPNALQNFVNIYEPAHGSLTGVLAVNNFANPITFLCGAIQAASRLGAEQSAKLCVQYLAPIVKNRQYNFLPFGDEPLRRRAGPAQRGHLQRGLDASRLPCPTSRHSRPAARNHAAGAGAGCRRAAVRPRSACQPTPPRQR